MQELLALYSSGAMKAAAPDGTPRGGSITIKKPPYPPCLGEALNRELFVYGRFSGFGCERTGSYPFLQSHFFLKKRHSAHSSGQNYRKNTPYSSLRQRNRCKRKTPVKKKGVLVSTTGFYIPSSLDMTAVTERLIIRFSAAAQGYTVPYFIDMTIR
jgi:hypothetical protein